MTKANKIKKVKKEKDSTLKKKLNKENCKCIEIKESDIKVGRLTGKDAAKRVFQEQQLRKKDKTPTIYSQVSAVANCAMYKKKQT